MANADTAGIELGARVPIILTAGPTMFAPHGVLRGGETLCLRTRQVATTAVVA